MVNIPITIIGYEDDMNLSGVSWNQKFLEKVQQKYKLKHRESILFSNRAKDRFRLVANFFGMAVLVLPPVDPEKRLSLYLKVSQFLRKFSGTGMESYMDARIEFAKVRWDRKSVVVTAIQKRLDTDKKK